MYKFTITVLLFVIVTIGALAYLGGAEALLLAAEFLLRVAFPVLALVVAGAVVTQ